MKYIEKSSGPNELAKWVKMQGELNCRYDNLPSEIRSTVKKRLLEDQGYLCSYTGIRISKDRSHIEHLKPQSVYYENKEDVDYTNLVAAYPGPTPPKCAYGAHPKSNWYDEILFVSPLNRQCETAFQYKLNGEIQAAEGNTAAQTTLDRLNLKDESLTEMRYQMIQEFLFEEGISLTQAQTLLEKIYDRNPKGEFRPFCFVLKQACEEYIRRVKQKQTRNKAIQSKSQTKRSNK